MTYLSLITLLFCPLACYADENPPHFDHWKKVVEEGQPLERPPEQNWELSPTVRTFNEFEGKQILSFVREGDYAHAGEEEAIDLIFSYFENDPNRTILDVACGLGGTAHYIQKKGWGKVTAFDIEKKSIDYARLSYPEIEFLEADACSISPLKGRFFDLICIVNSFVCFPNQLNCLKELKKVALPSTQLVIFDYTAPKDSPMAGKGKEISFLPIRPKQIGAMADEAGWKITQYVNLDRDFVLWYEKFIQRVESKRSDIDKKFGKNATNFTRGKYDLIYHGLKNDWLGGCLIVLKPKKSGEK